MILFKSDPINFPYLDYSVVFIISNENLLETKRELKLSWDWEEETDLGQSCWASNNLIYCIIKENSERLTILHESLHCINTIYDCINATIDCNNDEIYVRQASWLQEQILTLWDNYFKDLAINETRI